MAGPNVSLIRRYILISSLYSTAPSAAPENITATAITATQILVSWDPPPPEHRNGPILAYNFTATDASTGLVVSSAILQTRSSLVSSLRPFTLYNFTLSARTSVGYGPSGSAVETTLQDSECGIYSVLVYQKAQIYEREHAIMSHVNDGQSRF